MNNERIINDIENKYQQLGENPETYLKGLLHAKPINYWDYVEADTLLSLQKPRTNFKDEEIFIMYHQVTELFLKMMVHEIKQLVYEPFNEDVWLEKLDRLNRYTNMLIGSFDVMKYGMNYDDYNTFRSSLTPASGFQSVTFRLIEIYCTRLENLINKEGKNRIGENPNTTDYFEHIYWKDAGLNRKTGKKSLTLLQFEEKYLDRLVAMANKTKGSTLEDKVLKMQNCSEALKTKLKEFDHLYNVAWPLVHLETAQHYLDLKGENKAATGGSEWKKYLHPKFQQRKFFPTLWNNDEITNWGNNKLHLKNSKMNIQENNIIGELVAQDYRAASVFKKYGIDFCCQGNRTIQDACEAKQIDASSVVTDLIEANKATSESTIDYQSWPIDLMADYIEKKHHRYVEDKTQELKPYLDKICRVHGDRHPELLEINEHFNATASELAAHMKKEELILFPFVRKMAKVKQENTKLEAPHFGTVENPIQMMMHEHTTEGERFRKIEALSNNYTPPADACNTYRVTFALLKEFEADLHLHIHLENNILFPKAIELEKQLSNA